MINILDQFKSSISLWSKGDRVTNLGSVIDAIKISLHECLTKPGTYVVIVSEVVSIVANDTGKAVRELQFSELLRSNGDFDPIIDESDGLWEFDNGSTVRVMRHDGFRGGCHILIANLAKSCREETQEAMSYTDENTRIIIT